MSGEIYKLNQNRSLDLNPVKKDVTDEKLREVADLYEKHFIKEMMKQMKSTVPESGLLKKNNAEKIFEDQLDDQYSHEWNKRGGFGLSDMIYEQLNQKFGNNSGLNAADIGKSVAGQKAYELKKK